MSSKELQEKAPTRGRKRAADSEDVDVSSEEAEETAKQAGMAKKPATPRKPGRKRVADSEDVDVSSE